MEAVRDQGIRRASPKNLEENMNYLTIIATVWAICAICAVLFIRGSAAQQMKPARVRRDQRTLAERIKDFSHTA
ncbi:MULTISPECIES: hypothetical protein [unclassified Caballeronia]|uniref:hypothetical protein n=2 Tax=unclassified Caballeronia TaxID=2646786 RepID=UPI002028C9AF|nr:MULTISPECIES: hypothetical protein [unclassified Caballeronia]MDR5773834.1 hypothetical protein [Caballeronia sp. LZ002]MDR5849269.1 hypothetical protein [Caballeronia sp. LZ003]